MGLKVGQKAHREMTVTDGTVKAYAEVSGDYNPLHFDLDFVGRTRFKRLIAQGGVTTGLLHALVAMDIPGPGSVFMSQSWTFPKPVYIGDTIRAEATVTSVHEGRPISEIQFEIVNQDGEKVLQGQGTVFRAAPER